MLHRLLQLLESHLFILCLALVVGLFIPAAQHLTVWSTLCLQVIFFFSSLKLSSQQVVRSATNWKLLLGANSMMLLGLPLLVRLIAPWLVPDMALALFLLAAMPVGMTSPLLVEVVGGNHALALVLTTATSLLAPFSIPLVTYLAYGASLAVDPFGMVQRLCLVLVVPFGLALVARRFLSHAVARFSPHTKPISVLLLGILIAGAVASQAPAILASLHAGWGAVRMLAVLFLFFACLHLIGYWSLWWEPRAERETITVCLTYMNFTLAIYLATTFFPQPAVLAPLVLSIIPWVMLLPAWRWSRARF